MKIAPLVPVLLFLMSQSGNAQTTISTSMDWGSGLFRVLAVRPLDSGMSPGDHPQALHYMEQELTPLIIENLGQLAWNSSGILADFAAEQPKYRSGMETLTRALNREWSRLSIDRKSVEAEYTVNAASIVANVFPVKASVDKPDEPIGWVPVPEDPWTGIIIYAPSDLPIRGTGLTAAPRQALRARILGPELKPLSDPNIPPIPYFPLAKREEIDAMVGRRPYRAMARELYGKIPCDLILGLEDSQRIMASESGRRALVEGRIAILLDN